MEQASSKKCRGLVACASAAGEKDSNGSQFFITLERCDQLDRLHTIFGRVSGETVFTVTRMGEVEVGEDDRPLDPPKIVNSEVLWPPFDDIVPRTTPTQRLAAAAAAAELQRLEDITERKQKGALHMTLSYSVQDHSGIR